VLQGAFRSIRHPAEERPLFQFVTRKVASFSVRAIYAGTPFGLKHVELLQSAVLDTPDKRECAVFVDLPYLTPENVTQLLRRSLVLDHVGEKTIDLIGSRLQGRPRFVAYFLAIVYKAQAEITGETLRTCLSQLVYAVCYDTSDGSDRSFLAFWKSFGYSN
jgi:hypothetical protein